MKRIQIVIDIFNERMIYFDGNVIGIQSAVQARLITPGSGGKHIAFYIRIELLANGLAKAVISCPKLLENFIPVLAIRSGTVARIARLVEQRLFAIAEHDFRVG